MNRFRFHLDTMPTIVADEFSRFIAGKKSKAILADPPWQFQNRPARFAPEHKRLSRYSTIKLDDVSGDPKLHENSQFESAGFAS